MIIQIRHKEGCAPNRIAAEIGCAPNTVRNELRRGTVDLHQDAVQLRGSWSDGDPKPSAAGETLPQGQWESDKGIPDVENLKLLANVLGGIPLFDTQKTGKTINTLDHQYYLVNEGSKQYFVLLTDEFIIARALANRIEEKKFTIEDREFQVMGKVE